MHSGGYLDPDVNKTSPTRLGVIIALHGAALAAIMLAPAEITERPTWFPPLKIYPVPEPQPPEPITKKQPAPEGVKPVARPDEPSLPLPTFPPLPPIDLGKTIQSGTDGSGSGETGGTVPLNPVFVEATITKGSQLQPDYPITMARQEIEGVVTVRVLIGTDGRVKDVQQITATDPDFFKATERQALRYWRFKPATRDGVAVESWRQMTVRFKLQA